MLTAMAALAEAADTDARGVIVVPRIQAQPRPEAGHQHHHSLSLRETGQVHKTAEAEQVLADGPVSGTRSNGFVTTSL